MMQQMDTYISWINRQLQEHPKGRLVTDLQKDMRDGVVFLQLVEVIGGVDQKISYDVGLSIGDMRTNINRVLEFLSNNNVRVHHIAPKEIMEGKLKSIMRLVLALAAHFKPNSFECQPLDQSFPGVWKSRKKLDRTSSLVSLLSNAAVSLADASKNAAGNNNLRFRNDNFSMSAKKINAIPSLSSSLNITMGIRETVNIVKLSDDMVPNRTGLPHNSRPSSNNSIPTAAGSFDNNTDVLDTSNASTRSMDSPSYISSDENPDCSLASTPDLSTQVLGLNDSPTSHKPARLPPYPSHISMCNQQLPMNSTPKKTENMYKVFEGSPVAIGLLNQQERTHQGMKMNEAEEFGCYSNEIIGFHDEMLDDVSITKSILSELHNLLVNGKTPEEEEETGFNVPHDESFEEQLILRNVMLEQKDEECSFLKSELNELKEINIQWSGEKVALQTRLSQQEQVILALKFRLLQYEISSKNKNKDELDKIVEDHKKQMQQLRGELAMKNDIIHKQKLELTELNSEVQSKSDLEASLQSKLESQETKVCCLQKQLHEVTESLHSSVFVEKVRDDANIGAITGKLNEAKFHRDAKKILREHKNMCTTLSNIRQKFKAEDPIQHAFESMEQSMTSLVDTLTMMETTMQTKENHTRMLGKPKICNMNMISSDSGHENNVISDPGERLKLIYYLGKSTTPVLKVSDIELGSFTLRDFKKAVSRSGRFRYFFKSVDSDFGYVREELFYDDDVVPGHDNKVVAWLESASVTEV